MKRILALALAVMLLCTACGQKKTNDNTDKGGNTATIQLGDATVTVGEALTAEIKTALGVPASVEEAPSCHFEGMDTVYHYDGVSLQTYRKDNADVLCVVTIESADYPTAKGIKVGDSGEAVKNAYGEAAETTNYYVVYDLTDKVTLTFELDDDKVAVILYEEKV